MATNGEWLDYLAHNAPDELSAWFDAEHVANQKRALDGDTAALNAKIAELTAERDNLADELLIANKQREWYREKFGKCIDYADAIHALMDDEGMA